MQLSKIIKNDQEPVVLHNVRLFVEYLKEEENKKYVLDIFMITNLIYQSIIIIIIIIIIITMVKKL